MHMYMRAIGFSEMLTKAQERQLLQKMEEAPYHGGDQREEHAYSYAEKRCEVGDGFGVILHGYQQVENHQFIREYYYPYMEGICITQMEAGYVRRHTDKESYAVLCEEYNMGSALIFYLTNGMEYQERQDEGLPLKLRSFALTGLSVYGKILLPVYKTEKQIARINANLENRNRMLEAAKGGDVAAVESLSLDDMNTYGQISRRMVKEDIYSIVDTCFMPTGVECDNYMVIGEIKSYELVENSWTGEKIYRMVISCNGIDITIGINEKDLMGEPQVGRRFKGDIWLQGIGCFDESTSL